MQSGQVFTVASVNGVHFTDGLLQNAIEYEHLVMPSAIAGGGTCAARLRSVRIWSSQQLAWDVWLFDRELPWPVSPDPNIDGFRGYWEFDAAGGKQIAGAGLYYYMIWGLDVDYEDTDFLQHTTPGGDPEPRLHVGLINRSQTKKEPYAIGGHVRVAFVFEPTLGW